MPSNAPAESPVPPPPPIHKGRFVDPPTPKGRAVLLTSDQERAVSAVERVVSGHRRRPVVLVAHRGRGKSTALGVAAARLVDAKRVGRVAVVAPHGAAVSALLEHAGPAARERIDVVSPWAAAGPLEADLVLVDEAAAVPVHLLAAMLEHHARIAFATTVHGYEGTGRGFELRFRAVLDRLTPQWREIPLRQPVRWSEGDPLERLFFEMLLLDAEPAPAEALAGVEPVVERIDRDRLAADELLLRQLFGLLVTAHYRTRPHDLRALLDAPGVTLHAALCGGAVAGVAVAQTEGGFDAETAEAIWSGRRRPRGHLMAQSLAIHAGVEDAPRRRFQRITRIAVHPALRRRGIGRRLVAAVTADAAAAGADLVGSSFGATEELVAFWRGVGLQPVRVGSRRDAASGAHSVMVAAPLTAAGEAVTAEARRRLGEGAAALLGEPLAGLEPEIASAVFAGSVPPPPLPAWAVRDLEGFAGGDRGYEPTLPALTLLALNVLLGSSKNRCPGVVPEFQCGALIMKVLQRRPWAEVAGFLGVAGRRPVVAGLRAMVRAYLTGGGALPRE